MKNCELVDNYEFENAMMIQTRINQLENALKSYPNDKFLLDQLDIAKKEKETVINMSKKLVYNRRIEINLKDMTPAELGSIYSMLNQLCGESNNRITYESFDE